MAYNYVDLYDTCGFAKEEDMDLLNLDEAQLQKHRADGALDAALRWIAQHGATSPKTGTPSEKQQRQKLEARRTGAEN